MVLVLNRPIIAGEAGPEAIIPLNRDGVSVIAQAMNDALNLGKPNIGNGEDRMESLKDFLLEEFITKFAEKIRKQTKFC